MFAGTLYHTAFPGVDLDRAFHGIVDEDLHSGKCDRKIPSTVRKA